MNAILLASAGVVILVVGGGVGYWLGRSGVGGSKARVEKAEADLEQYKRSVTEHFGQTASYFQAIGKQYRELYEHMASGAQSLCDPNEEGGQLLFAPGIDTALSKLEEPLAEAVDEAEVRSPIDYVEPRVASEIADAAEAAKESADESVVETTAEAESVETGVADRPDTETAAESQPGAKIDAGERTIH